MKRRRISSEDVARKAGVSRTTVSFVLNNTPGKQISEETRQRVLRAAEELGYVPNEYARRLAMSRQLGISLIISTTRSTFSDAFVVRLLEGMSQAVNRSRYHLTIAPVPYRGESYRALVRRTGAEGVILMNSHEDDPGYRDLAQEGVPLVVIGRSEDGRGPSVDIDNRDASRRAVRHLIELGHRDIGVIAHAPLGYHAASERVEGYRAALEEAGIPYRADRFAKADFSEESGYAATVKLLDAGPPPTALFACRDAVAFGALRALNEAGLDVPGDVSLIGFDDDYLSRFIHPALTSVSVPAAGIGSAAADLLIRILNGKAGGEDDRILLPTHLALRNSIRAIE